MAPNGLHGSILLEQTPALALVADLPLHWPIAVRTSRMCVTDADAAAMNEAQRQAAAEADVDSAVKRRADAEVTAYAAIIQGGGGKVFAPSRRPYSGAGPFVQPPCGGLASVPRPESCPSRPQSALANLEAELESVQQTHREVEAEKAKAERELKELMVRNAGLALQLWA
eukprot:scaffold290013_cov36-Tisochrysis_lutea.AAC.2